MGGHGIENTGVNLEASFVTKKQRTNEALDCNPVCSAALTHRPQDEQVGAPGGTLTPWVGSNGKQGQFKPNRTDTAGSRPSIASNLYC